MTSDFVTPAPPIIDIDIMPQTLLSNIGKDQRYLDLRSYNPFHEGRLSILDVNTSESDHISTLLSPSEEVGRLLKCFFDEMETFYPCVDRIDFYERLAVLFVEHSVSQGAVTYISASPECISFAALVCGMLCLGTYLDCTATSNNAMDVDDYLIDASKHWHFESRRLLEHFSTRKDELNDDILILHLLEVIFMTIFGRKGEVTKAMAIALDIGLDLKLNDEFGWRLKNQREREHRRLLWLTLCYMERRVALRHKRPISIRGADILVNKFDLSCREYLSDQHLSTATVKQNRMLLKWPLPACRGEEWFQYIQFLSQWCEIVTGVWDDVFSLRASKLPSLQKIVMTDTSLMHLETSLPPGLRWNPMCVPVSLSLGDFDRGLRLQLVAFEAINIVRLQLRSQLGLDFEELSVAAKPMAEPIASKIIFSIVCYLNVRHNARPWSTYASLLLTDACLHIAAIVKFHEWSGITPWKALELVSAAQMCLWHLGQNLKVSIRAAERLDLVISDVCGTLPQTHTGAVDFW